MRDPKLPEKPLTFREEKVLLRHNNPAEAHLELKRQDSPQAFCACGEPALLLPDKSSPSVPSFSSNQQSARYRGHFFPTKPSNLCYQCYWQQQATLASIVRTERKKRGLAAEALKMVVAKETNTTILPTTSPNYDNPI